MLKTKSCKHGVFTYFDNDRFIGRQLDVLGYYSENEVQTLIGLVTPDSVVVDAGANIGAITVPLAKKVKRVYAFEPQPAIFDLLCCNIVRNKLTNVTARKVAIGGRAGRAEVPHYDMAAPDMNTGAIPLRLVPPKWRVRPEAIIVPVVTLDMAIRERVDLVKADVEDMELDVVAGASRIIRESQPILYLENNVEASPENSVRLIRQMLDLGYELCWHLPILERLTNATHEILTLSSNMLCIPPSRPVTVGSPDFWPIDGPDDDWHRIPQYARALAVGARLGLAKV